MDYFQSSSSISPPHLPFSSNHQKSPYKSAFFKRNSNQDHLSAGSSPHDETDPPPFVPSPDDHVSLNQLDRTNSFLNRIPMSSNSSGKLRQHRSTSSIGSKGTIRNDTASAYRCTPKGQPRGRSKIEQHPRRRRPISVPGKKAVCVPSRPHWPSPADGSNQQSEAGNDNYSPETDKHSFHYNDAGHVSFQANRRVRRAKTHSGLSIPYEIRLRRASDREPDSSSRRLSLPALMPAPTKQNVQLDLALALSNKAAPAEPALTQTYVHAYLPSEQPCEDRRLSTSEGRRRLSATLQVVRSRDSVYEVIWEDIAAILDTPSTTGSSSSSSPGLHLSAYFPDTLRSRHLPVKTDLASWSWGGELGKSRSRDKKKQEQDGPDRPLRSSLKQKTVQVYANRLRSSNLSNSGNPGPSQMSSDTSPECVERVVGDNEERPGSRGRRSRIPRPTAYHVFGAVLPAQRSPRLLRDQKLSDLVPEQDHFASHRDSLVLAHERILGNKGPSAGGADTEAEPLRLAAEPKRATGDADTKDCLQASSISTVGLLSPSAVEAELTKPLVGQAKRRLKMSLMAANRSSKRRRSQTPGVVGVLE